MSKSQRLTPNKADKRARGVHSNRGQVQRWLEFTASCLVVLTIILLVAEWRLSFSPKQLSIVRGLELGILIFFVAELVFNFVIAESKREFLRRNWVNIFALIPIVRALRAARLLRAAKLLKVLGRTEKATKTARKVRSRIWPKL